MMCNGNVYLFYSNGLHFGKYAYLVSCQELYKKIDTTLISVHSIWGCSQRKRRTFSKFDRLFAPNSQYTDCTDVSCKLARNRHWLCLSKSGCVCVKYGLWLTSDLTRNSSSVISPQSFLSSFLLKMKHYCSDAFVWVSSFHQFAFEPFIKCALRSVWTYSKAILA